jgi:hypothetical protein
MTSKEAMTTQGARRLHASPLMWSAVSTRSGCLLSATVVTHLAQRRRSSAELGMAAIELRRAGAGCSQLNWARVSSSPRLHRFQAQRRHGVSAPPRHHRPTDSRQLRRGTNAAISRSGWRLRRHHRHPARICGRRSVAQRPSSPGGHGVAGRGGSRGPPVTPERCRQQVDGQVDPTGIVVPRPARVNSGLRVVKGRR